MCGPFVIPMIGAAVSAAGAVAGGMAAKQQADYQAAAAKANAGAALAQSYAQAGAVRDQYGEVAAQQRAQLAASGVNVDSGTSATLALETQKRTEQGAATQIWQGRSEATAYKNQADVAKAQGKAAMVTAGISAAGSILGGVAGGMQSAGGFGGGAPPAGPMSLGVAAQPVVGAPNVAAAAPAYTGPQPVPRKWLLYPGIGGRMTL